MAVATSVQAQWDIGNSAFSVSGKIWGLMKAATVDDVQPAAVYAAEAIGAHMVVDQHLIGKAVDALGGDQSYRLDAIKLHLGLSSGGIAGQIRQSSAATRAFLLVTVLRLHLDANEIGDLLYEFLVDSNALEKTPVSSKQLRDFVQSVEAHSVRLREMESIPTKVIVPLLEVLAKEDKRSQSTFFEPLSPVETSRLLVPLFEALRDTGVKHIILRGLQSGVWLASLLCWLCPDEIEVIDQAGNVALACDTSPARLSIIMGSHSRKWSIEKWYRLDEPSFLFNIPRDDTYPQTIFPSSLPIELTFVLLGIFHESVPQEALHSVATLSHGLMLAALEHGMLVREGEFRGPPQMIKFREICSREAEMRIRRGSPELGLSLTSQDLESGLKISGFFGQEKPNMSPENRANLVRRLNEEVLGGSLGTIVNANSQLMDLAMCVAETIIIRATQTGRSDIPFRAILHDRAAQFPVLCPLLDGSSLSATSYFYWSLACLTMKPRESQRDATARIVASSSNGLIAYCRGFQYPPRSPAEAFEIIVQPGQLKWRDVPQRFLYEHSEFPDFSTSPRCAYYGLVDDSQSNLKLAPLLKNNTPHLSLSIKLATNGVHLRCAHPSTGDKNAELITALVNWAIARRPEPSTQSIEEQLAECTALNLRRLQFKCPKYDGVYYDSSWSRETTAVASYSDDEVADLFRFGTFEAKQLHCFIQGSATLFDCVLQAHKLWGGGYIIMANP